MKYHRLLALLAALMLALSACGTSGGKLVSGEAQLPVPSSQVGDAPLGADASEPEDAFKADDNIEEVAASEYGAYLKKYLVPYGNLKFYDKDWTNAADLGADLIFEFTLQKNFNFYDAALDYAAVFGDEFTYLQVPEKWADPTYGLVYPQDIIENTAIEYFGADKELLRTAKTYLPTKNGYSAPEQTVPQDGASTVNELLPEVTGVRRSGSRAEITFTLTPCDALGKPVEGSVLTRVMVVEDKEESFRYVSVKSA